MLSQRAMGLWVGACLVLLAACGGDDSAESAASTTSATSTSTSTTTSTTTTTIPVEPGPYVGTFYNIDSDGSQQMITIEAVAPAGDDAYSYNYLYGDSSAIACIDVVGSETPIAAEAPFVARTGEHILVVEDLQWYCLLNGPDDREWELFQQPAAQVRYDPESDRLATPLFEVEGDGDRCWTREPPGPVLC